MAKIIDGALVAKDLQQRVAEDVAALKARKGITPGLAIVLVNSPVARKGVAELKRRACESAGIYCEVHALNSLSRQEDVIKLITRLNRDPKITGVNIHPLPPQISYKAVVAALDPAKDVEGVHPQNMGKFLIGEKTYIPFTPRGILSLVESTGTDLKGKRAVIVGRSRHVGLPVGFLLLEHHATVTFAHSRSWYLEHLTREADVLIVSAGHPEMITGAMVKPGAVVIDVGVNLVGDHLVGDVEHDSVREVAGWLTPVPGGVGPMTIASLLLNLVDCCKTDG